MLAMFKVGPALRRIAHKVNGYIRECGREYSRKHYERPEHRANRP